MPNTREKLIELISQVQDYGTKHTNEQWSVTVQTKCNETIADHLIVNGVTFANNNTRFFIKHNKKCIKELSQIIGSDHVIFADYEESIIPIHPWRWIPVSERLPDASQYVLCFVLLDGGYEGQRIKTTYYYGNGRFSKDKPTDRITHWMPLPEPPKGE